MKYQLSDGFPYYAELTENKDFKLLFESDEYFELYKSISEEQSNTQYAEGKWSLKHKDEKAGFPVTATFREIVKVTEATATLKDATGAEVPVWLSTPEKTAQPQGQRNTVGLIAQDPLKPATTYTVTVEAKVDGKPWKKVWKFTTKK